MSKKSLKNDESVRFHSTALNRGKIARVILPKEYHKKGLYYPTLYLLHGWGGNRNSWIENINLEKHLKKYELIVVLPESGRKWFINDYEGIHYEDYLIKELIPYIDDHYNTIPSKEGRAIAGFSMGGAAALMQAFRHPDLFSVVASHCGAVSAPSRVGDPYADLRDLADMHMPSTKDHKMVWGPPDSSTCREYDLFKIIKKVETNNLPAIYIDIGLEDYVRVVKTNREFHSALNILGIEPDYHEWHGKHDWKFLKKNIKYSLDFITEHLSLSQPKEVTLKKSKEKKHNKGSKV